MASNVRRVRCPRCWSVLEELPGVLLYSCGGCGNILQAKNKKLESDRPELSSLEANNVVNSLEDDGLEDKEARSSVHVSTGPSSFESSPDKDSATSRDAQRDSNSLICGEEGFPDALPSSLQGTCPNEGASVEDQEPLRQDNLKGEGSKGFNCELDDDNGGWIGSSSSGIPSSGEFANEVEVCAAEPNEILEEQEKSYLQEDENEGRVSQRMWQEGDEFADAVRDSPELQYTENVLPPNIEHGDGNVQNDVPPENDANVPRSSPDQEQDSGRGIQLNGLDSPSAFVSDENGDGNAPHLAEQGIEADDMAADSPLTSSSEKAMNLDRSDSMATSQRSFNDSLASYLTCPEDEPSPSVGALHNFEKAGTLADRNSELNLKQRSMLNKLPIDSAYYGYGGGRSECDSMVEQISVCLPSRKGKGKDVDNIRTTEMLIKNAHKATNVNIKPERDYRTSNSHRSISNSQRGQEKYAETTGYASESILKRDKQGVSSTLPHYSGDPLVGHRTHGHSRNHHNLLPPRPHIRSSGNLLAPHPHIRSSSQASYLGMDKLGLLRTMDALKDQVNRMQLPEAMIKRRFPDRVMDGKFRSFNHDHLAAEHEMYPDLNHPGEYTRHNQSNGCPEQYNISRKVYSGEAARQGHHISCSCLHCCPKDWRHSAQFPLRFHQFQNDSCVSSEFSLYDTKSNNPRVDERRSRMQEKRHAVKRYARPVAGAAPYLACYHCSKVLQLPADFLIFKKRFHELMCNACKKVLKFSLENGTHLVPYIPDASAPPPSVVEDYSRNLEQPSDSNSCQHLDAGWSSCRRCSMQGALERVESVGSSTRIPRYVKSISEIPDPPPSSTHRLHHLMGYSSPSKVYD